VDILCVNQQDCGQHIKQRAGNFFLTGEDNPDANVQIDANEAALCNPYVSYSVVVKNNQKEGSLSGSIKLVN
jgi:hypothetical protein